MPTAVPLGLESVSPGFRLHRHHLGQAAPPPHLRNAAALGAEPVVYYSGKVFLALIVTLGQKLGAPEATPEHSAKDSKHIFERRFEYSNEEKSSNESSFEDSKIRTKTKFEGLQRMPAGLGE